jgi:hypothetical protein
MEDRAHYRATMDAGTKVIMASTILSRKIKHYLDLRGKGVTIYRFMAATIYMKFGKRQVAPTAGMDFQGHKS